MVSFSTHDIMIFGEINGKLLQKTDFLKNEKKKVTCNPNNREFH